MEKRFLILFLLLIIFGSSLFILDIFNGSENTIVSSDGNENIHTNSSQNNEINLRQITKYPKIAFVKPTFTAAAYSGFYSFYSCESAGTCDPKTAGAYFVRKLRNSWGTSSGASTFITKLNETDGYPSELLSVINDEDVHFNNLYDEENYPLYGTIVFFHNEYITIDEYRNTINFIKNGGNVIFLNGNAFFAEVDYNEKTGDVILVNGHGYIFDGQNGTKNNYWRFYSELDNSENFEWLGSRYSSFQKGSTDGAVFNITNSNPHPIALEMADMGISRIATNYKSHEENSLITSKAHIIADWVTNFQQSDRGIKIYEYFPDGPIGGSLIHFGFFGSDILASDTPSRKAFICAVLHQNGFFNIPWIRYPSDNSVFSNNILLDYTKGYQVEVYIDDVNYHILDRYTKLDFLPEGSHNLTILFHRGIDVTTRSVNFIIDRTKPNVIIDYTEIDGKIDHVSFSIDDDNPESLIGTTYSGNTSRGSVRKNVDQYGNIENIDYTKYYKGSNESRHFKIEVVDAAGNHNTNWFKLNLSSNNNLLIRTVPTFQQINSTTAKVSIPKVIAGYSVYLEKNDNHSIIWQKYKLKNVGDEAITYIQKTTPDFIYRISVYDEETLLFYMAGIYSFTWDSSVISIQDSNINKIHDQNSKLEMTLFSENKVNFTTKLSIIDDNGNILSETINSSLSYLNEHDGKNGISVELIKPLNDIADGIYIVEVSVYSNLVNWSTNFSLFIGKNIDENQNIEEYSLDYGTNFYYKPESHSYDSVFVLSCGNYQTIIPLHTSLMISITNPLEIQIFEYSKFGDIIYNTLISIEISNLPPEIIPQFDLNATIVANQSQIFQWKIHDNNDKGNYTLHINDKNIEGTWKDGDIISYDIIITNVGICKITLIVEDEMGLQSTFRQNFQIVENNDTYQHTTTTTNDKSSTNKGKIDVLSMLLGIYIIGNLRAFNKTKWKQQKKDFL